MAKYVYPAVFTREENGLYSVNFPDLSGCYTSGDDLTDAVFMAEDVLAYTLYEMEKDEAAIPAASDASTLVAGKGEFINYIACDTIGYARMHNNKAVKKTLTIPEWLNDAASKANINFSQVLQEALIQKMNL